MGRIDTLLASMTLEEKIGQLNMVAASRVVTGPGELRDLQEGIRSGRIGNLLNLWGADETRDVQRLAVEESRLGVPLLMGLDVIHGHHTIFPVSLAEACLFDPDLWEKTARFAAEEAAEDGIALTFAPMLDVARDPRWGRIIESSGEDASLRWEAESRLADVAFDNIHFLFQKRAELAAVFFLQRIEGRRFLDNFLEAPLRRCRRLLCGGLVGAQHEDEARECHKHQPMSQIHCSLLAGAALALLRTTVVRLVLV